MKFKKIIIIVACFLFLVPFNSTLAQSDNIPTRTNTVICEGYHKHIIEYNPFSENPSFGIALMYEPLFNINTKENTPIPVIGTFYNWSLDGSNITILLNSNAKWSDGQDINADDVVYTYQLAGNQSKYAGDWDTHVDQIVKIDNYTVCIKVLPNFEFSSVVLDFITTDIPILPKHIWEEIAFLYQNPTTYALGPEEFKNDIFNTTFNEEFKVFSGPYIPYEQNISTDTRFEIYKLRDNWWGKDVIHLDLPSHLNGKFDPPSFIESYLYRTGNENAFAYFLKGYSDFYYGFVDDFAEQMSTHPNIESWYGRNYEQFYFPHANIYDIVPNHLKYPLNETWFRKALAYSIDYNNIISQKQGSYLSRARQGLLDDRSPMQQIVYNPQIQSAYGISFSSDTVNLLLEKHCYRVNNTWYTNSNESIPDTPLGPYEFYYPLGWGDYETIIQSITETFNQNNIELMPIGLPPEKFGQYVSLIENHTFNFIINYGLVGIDTTPYNFYKAYIGSSNWQRNASYWINNTFVNLFKDLEFTSANLDAQISICSQMQEIYATNVPTIPLFVVGTPYFYRTDYWVGWLNYDNYYQQPTNLYSIKEISIKQRLFLNLRQFHEIIFPTTLILFISTIFLFIAFGSIVSYHYIQTYMKNNRIIGSDWESFINKYKNNNKSKHKKNNHSIKKTPFSIKIGTKELEIPDKINRDEFLSIFDQGYSLKQLKKLLNKKDIALLSEDFLVQLNSLGWNDDSISDFLREMYYFSPKEREEILQDIIDKSFE